MTEKTKQIAKVAAWVAVITGIGYWWLHSSLTNNKNTNNNSADTQTVHAAAAIANFKQKYGAVDNWRKDDWTIKTQLSLTKSPTPIVYRAQINDVFVGEKDIIVRTYIPMDFLDDTAFTSYYIDLKCNEDEIVNKVITHKPDTYSTNYVVVATLENIKKPSIMLEAGLPDTDGSTAGIEINSSEVYLGTGKCIDFAYIN